jgi:hypothetical protein
LSKLPRTSDVDVLEDELREVGAILDILLVDRSSSSNLIWATDSYADRGRGFSQNEPIQKELITGDNRFIIQPRVAKSALDQAYRTREKAEVFTPLAVVERMNRAADRQLGFSRPSNGNWQTIVDSRRLELACGEGPFIASRYDPTSKTQKLIDVNKRVGFFDRKMQCIIKFADTYSSWLALTKRALQSSYGYEWQGDSLLIARENLLLSVVDYYQAKFGVGSSPATDFLEECAEIISWNLIQMDGIKFVVPMSCSATSIPEFEQLSFFDAPDEKKAKSRTIESCPGCANGTFDNHNGISALIKNWETGEVATFRSLMFFDPV